MHPAQLPEETLLRDCDVQRTRRGGPGGQHRNKVSSAIVITHKPTSISGQASERRSQHANRDVAVHRLRISLAIGFRTPLSDTRSTGTRSTGTPSSVTPPQSALEPQNDSQPSAEILPADSLPTELWCSRVKAGKIAVNPAHTDFPALLAEALDSVWNRDFDVAAAAKSLSLSTSQLIKFLKIEPAALETVNRERIARELGRLK